MEKTYHQKKSEVVKSMRRIPGESLFVFMLRKARMRKILTMIEKGSDAQREEIEALLLARKEILLEDT
jgi:hypothetical protein